jgi:hypothetical protein
MKEVFISYRRSDTSDITDRIFDCLRQRLGAESLFMDIDAIDIGVDFRTEISSAVSSCKVLLAVIGTNWLRAADEQGRRRLDNPDDFVRLEIAAALERKIPVIPVLVHGVSMPAVEDLPEPLHELAFRHAIAVRRNPDFPHDIRRLESQLSKMIPYRRRLLQIWVATFIVGVAAIGLVVWAIVHHYAKHDEYLDPMIPFPEFAAQVYKLKNDDAALTLFMQNKQGKRIKWKCRIVTTSIPHEIYEIAPVDAPPLQVKALANFHETGRFDKQPTDAPKVIDATVWVPNTLHNGTIDLEDCRFVEEP